MEAQVSVIIPTYNRAHLLTRALESVFAQTMTRFEVIVVDDGSTDETSDVLSTIQDPRLSFIRNDDRAGASAARNVGLRACRGSFIAFLDSDDEWLPSKLEQQLNVFGQASPDTGLVYTGIENLYPARRSRIKVPRHRGVITRSLLLDNVVGSTSAGMVRRSVFEEVGTFDESLSALQDADLWVRISQRFEIDFTPAVLTRIHMHEGADRISYGVQRRLAAREAFFLKHHRLFRAEGLEHKYHAQTAWICLRRARSRSASRRHARRAVQAQPLNPVGYLSYAASFVPLSAVAAGGVVRRTLRAAAEAALPR